MKDIVQATLFEVTEVTAAQDLHSVAGLTTLHGPCGGDRLRSGLRTAGN